MAAVSFHHGTRVFESAETPLLVRLAQTAVIGIIGTAPDADPQAFPLNKPVQILKPQDAALLGKTGTLAKALDSVYDTVICPVIIVRIQDAETAPALWANAIGDQISFTGVHAFRRSRALGLYQPKLLIAPSLTQSAASDGIASINVTIAGTGYKANSTVVSITGTGKGAEAEAIIDDGGAISAIIIKKPGFGFTGTPIVTISGDGSGATATANIGATMNPVVAELMGVADKMRAVAYVDAPDTTDQAAVQYRGLINSGRIIVCDPKVLKFDTDKQYNVPEPSSAIFAALQAKMDLEQGFWWAGSNMPIAGIVGINRPIEYGAQSNYLNENRVNTIVNIDNEGFRAWGVWTCDSDLMWQFIPVRRTADAINEGVEKAYLKFVDKPFSVANLKFMVEGARTFFRTMELEGAILPGWDVWLLESNIDSEMAQGIIKLGVQFEPPAPMVDIRITAHRNIASYTLLLNKVAQEINSGSLAAN